LDAATSHNPLLSGFKLRIRWIFTFILGLTGIVRAPFDYYFEVVLEQNLIAPIFAFMYTPLFAIMGLSTDISLMKLHPEKRPIQASVISSFILAATVLGTIAFAAFFFYPQESLSAKEDNGIIIALVASSPWLKVGVDFLIPYSLATGALGGYIGFNIAKDTTCTRRDRSMNLK
jgi:phosphate/sulfate permease